MKIIITENQEKLLHLYRRMGEIESLFDEYEDLFSRTANTLTRAGFNHAISMFIGDIIAGKTEETTFSKDFDYVTFRNQIMRFVQEHFNDKLNKFYYEHRKPLTESEDVSFSRRRESIIDLVDDGIETIRDNDGVCDYAFSDFLQEVCWQVSDNSNEFGIDTDKPGMIDQIHRWVRNNFSQYIKDEYLKLIDEQGCNDYDEDDIDNDYLSGFLYGVDNNQ